VGVRAPALFGTLLLIILLAMSKKFFTKPSLFISALLMTLAACGSADKSTTTESIATEDTAIEVVSTDVPATDAPTVSASNPAREGMHGVRYCEILLISRKDDGIHGEVFNTFPLNECPDDQWKAIDPAAVAKAEGVLFAMPNGPRYWAMDSVMKSDATETYKKTFGEMEMNHYASVFIGTNPAAMQNPYTPRAVDRKAAFTFNAGTTVYTLRDAEGKTYVMQSWSQQTDPELAEDDLLTLGERLQLPEGWTYDHKTLTQEFVVETRAEDAQVLSDDLRNSYSYVATAP
jgi:hypothetical protein